MKKQPIFRFAPSPNGELHLGHAYSALITWHMAQAVGGRFLLRIEDVDGGRARPCYEQQILEDLAWLGLKWETPVRRQSDHLDDYAAALQKLDDLELLYPCFASRKEIAHHPRNKEMPINPDGVPVYPGIYRDMTRREAGKRIAAGQLHTLRLAMQKAVQVAQDKLGENHWPPGFNERQSSGRYQRVKEPPQAWGDVVLARKDIRTSYSLAVVVDDALQGVTHVTRGEDLYYATSLQRLLQVLLDLPEPFYYHHPLIVDMTGRKLAKSDDDVSLKTIRATGISAEELCRQLPPYMPQE